ncbi:MAG: Hpt domain-containing protein [Blautia sp.]|nr:Hpt domain-containing protein [Blautia sp.]
MTVQELYDSIGGDFQAAKKILQMDKIIERFIKKLLEDPSYSSLMDAWKNQNYKELFISAHSLKGVCFNLGLPKLAGEASELSEEFRPGTPRKLTDEEVAAKINALSDLYLDTRSKIEAFSKG